MNKISKVLLFPLIAMSLSSCAFFEFGENKNDDIDLGNEENYVRWNLIENNNEYRPVTSAYFEFAKDKYRYYEDDTLKEEGRCMSHYFGVNDTRPLHIGLFKDEDQRKDGYLYCYTEDERENLHQFAIYQLGYEIQPLRKGGVPVRDYHLSEMPYAFGTYLKENSESYIYKSNRVNYLSSSVLRGSFVDDKGNKFYFTSNSYAPMNSKDGDYFEYFIYMRYENNVNHTSIEGTILMSFYDDWELGRRNVALLYVLHGCSEPAEEKGVYLPPDYQLLDFDIDTENNSFSFREGEYFHENRECEYDPSNFVPGTYAKVL